VSTRAIKIAMAEKEVCIQKIVHICLSNYSFHFTFQNANEEQVSIKLVDLFNAYTNGSITQQQYLTEIYKLGKND
jgi:hypothetical protein